MTARLGPSSTTPGFFRDLALIHPDYEQDAVDLDSVLSDRLRVRVLSPVDLALSKLARWGARDQSDVETLARAGLLSADALRARADEALRQLCTGEPWALDRRTEHLLTVVADATATDWRPALGGVPATAWARAGYLLTVLCDGLDRGRRGRWSSWLAELRRGVPCETRAEIGDDVAREWGLDGGLDVLRIRRVLRLRLV